MRYSIGSSTVIILISGFETCRKPYSVVVFPLPVGPVFNMRPFGRESSRLNKLQIIRAKPQLRKRHGNGVGIQKPHHDRLAKFGRDEGKHALPFLYLATLP